MKSKDYQELATLFFTTRSIIRSKVPTGKADPNEWLRHEALRFIGEDTHSMTEVAEFLNIKAPSATSLVSHLAHRGFVRTSFDTQDKRKTLISLTPSGKKQLARYKKHAGILMRDVFSPLGNSEVKEFMRILKEVIARHRRS